MLILDPKILDSRIYLALWLMVYAIVVFIAHRRRNKTGRTDEQILLTAGFSLVGAFSLLKTLVMTFVHYEILKGTIDWDGITALVISCALGSYLALKEVRKLF